MLQNHFYSNYVKRADECFYIAKIAFDNAKWTAAMINVVHCCIAACDAMCVYFIGRRHAGEYHNDAITLFKTIKIPKGIDINTNRIAKILRMKNIAEYEERLIKKAEVETSLKDCERLLEYVKKVLSGYA